jgi:hypothetical protein
MAEWLLMWRYNLFWIRWLDLLTPCFTVTLNYNQLQHLTINNDLLRLAPFLTRLWVSSSRLLFHFDWLGSDLRIGQFFSFRCPLVNTPQLNTQRNSTTELSSEFSSGWITSHESKVKSQSYVTTDSQSASLSWFKTPICALRPDVYYCQTVAGLLMGAPSLTRWRICRLQLLLALSSAVILGSESGGTHDHILLSQIRDSPNLEVQVPVFISPRNIGSLVIPPALDVSSQRILTQ